jgi:hypothetical protein
MDTTPNEVRKLNFDDYSTAKHLEHGRHAPATIRIS